MAEGRKAVFLLLLCLLVCCAGGCQRDRKSAGESVSKVCNLWKRQMLLSIAGGTIFYMILVQTIF